MPATDPSAPRILRVLETCLYVNDLDAAEEFYREVLGLQTTSRQAGRHVFFVCGDGMLLLFLPEACRDESADVPPHGATGAGHIAFAVKPSQLSDWCEQLDSQGVAIERTVDWPNGARSLYFRDPAGNSLELVSPELWFSAGS